MKEKAIQHTLNIFKQVYRNLPPLVGTNLREQIKQKLEEAVDNGELTLVELENFMIFYGKKIWPFVQAFEDIYHIYHEKLSEKLFLQKASKKIVKKYILMKETGVKFVDLFKGAVHHFFDHEDRLELSELLVSLKKDIRKYAVQAVMTHEKENYEMKINKYGQMVKDINLVIEDLHKFAKEENDRDFAEDVLDKAKTIEYSFAFLGPKISYGEIMNLLEYYVGKKEEKKMRRMF
ncbi:MAG: hypothetical protein WC025_01580 [Candidatus Magasanikbacteria bacterium]